MGIKSLFSLALFASAILAQDDDGIYNPDFTGTGTILGFLGHGIDDLPAEPAGCLNGEARFVSGTSDCGVFTAAGDGAMTLSLDTGVCSFSDPTGEEDRLRDYGFKCLSEEGESNTVLYSINLDREHTFIYHGNLRALYEISEIPGDGESVYVRMSSSGTDAVGLMLVWNRLSD